MPASRPRRKAQVGLKVVTTDAAGNSATATGSFTEDLTAPVATIGLKHDAADDTGTSATDSMTSNTKPTSWSARAKS